MKLSEIGETIVIIFLGLLLLLGIVTAMIIPSEKELKKYPHHIFKVYQGGVVIHEECASTIHKTGRYPNSNALYWVDTKIPCEVE